MDRQKLSKVKNKTPAAVQITAEQILREAKERTAPETSAPPAQKIADQEELDEYRLQKRKTFEDTVRRNRVAYGAWIRYAAWEESQHELERARSVFERALDVDHRPQVLWLKYAEMEMRHKNINRARNVFDRVVSILPKVDLFWYKYTYMEELLENVAGARQVFERWMEWEPTEEAWMAYVKFEMRYNEFNRAERVFERFVASNPIPKNWIKFAKFEEQNGQIETARKIYEQCMTSLGDEFIEQNFYVSFGKFETRCKEVERARVIYKYAMTTLPEGQKENLFNVYTQFEKQYGGKDAVEEAVTSKRRLKYEAELAENPGNYDTWFDYLRLEESTNSVEKVREVYERAIANIPPVQEKRLWRRYIYLWLFYAVFEETIAKEIERAKKVYQTALEVIPHKIFSFSKLWLQYAKFLIRNDDLNTARKILGMGIGLAPKDKLFRSYIEVELSLREFDRVRILYQKYLEWNPSNCYAWVKFTELEVMLGEVDRARHLFEIAINMGELDMPEVLWKAYIDFEVSEDEWENARRLYHQLLDRTDHVKVHVSLANFEYTALDNGSESQRLEKARKYFSSMNDTYRRQNNKDSRSVLLDAWYAFEQTHQDPTWMERVKAKLPRTIKKRRRVEDETGAFAGWEEYFDYVFPGDEQEKPAQKLLALAHQWKTTAADDDEDDDSEEDEDSDDEKVNEGEDD